MDSLELVQVTVLFRHGARSPVSSTQGYCDQLCIKFKDCALDLFFSTVNATVNLPHLQVHNSLQQALELGTQLKQVTPHGCFYGQLTKNGKKSLNSLGSGMRELYMGKSMFLPFQYDPKDVYLACTNYVRTMESLQYFMHGLYPPSNRSPSPMHVIIKPYSCETMGAEYTSCPKLVTETIEIRSSLVKKYNAEIKEALEPFNGLGLEDDITPERRVYRLFDLCTSLIGNGMDLPKNITEGHVKKLENTLIHVWYF